LSTFGRMPPATRSESSWSCGAGSTCAMAIPLSAPHPAVRTW
jgi:hypothetical protein